MITELRDTRAVVSVLDGLGLAPTGKVESLPGGVSNRVFRAGTASGDVVIKQSLERLMVAEEWLAPRERIIAEAAAMDCYHALQPTRTPALIASDPADFVLVMSAAPSNWSDWKHRLRNGTVDIDLAGSVGSALASWVVGTTGLESPSLDDPDRFRQLRIDPYFHSAAARRPELADALDGVVSDILERRVCAVHGDFSPKNILTDGVDFWITDFEVAHIGDPTFDVAFLSSHLVLKAIADAQSAPSLNCALSEFISAYLEGVGQAPGELHLGRVVGALLVARVVGRSPVEYLTPEQRDSALALGARLLTAPEAFWSHLEKERS